VIDPLAAPQAADIVAVAKWQLMIGRAAADVVLWSVVLHMHH
jgi:hypothetical protein